MRSGPLGAERQEHCMAGARMGFLQVCGVTGAGAERSQVPTEAEIWYLSPHPSIFTIAFLSRGISTYLYRPWQRTRPCLQESRATGIFGRRLDVHTGAIVALSFTAF